MARSKTVPFSASIDPPLKAPRNAPKSHINSGGGGMNWAEKPALKLWQLTARDKAEPPFHFTGVAGMYVVAATTEEEARYLAAMCSEPHGPVWMDDDMTDCVALAPKEPGVIAQG